MLKKLTILIMLMVTSLIGAEQQLLQTQGNNGFTKTKKVSYGSYLFEGNFGSNKKESFNDSYKINNKDVLNLIVWGAMSFEADLVVDLKGNIFIPEIGVIPVKGKTISQVNEVLQSRIKGIYKENVFHYITVKNYQKINVIVSGEVDNPGMYEGYPTDLIVEYIGQANGITDNGSYRYIKIKRNNKILEEIDLYNFIKDGDIKSFQFQEGDIVFVPKKKKHIYIEGECSFEGEFEIKGKRTTMQNVLEYITPDRLANEYILTYRNKEKEIKQVHTVSQAKNLYDKYRVNFQTNLVKNNIKVTVKGEHNGKSSYVVDRNTKLSNFIRKIQMNSRSENQLIKLYRESIKEQQQELLDGQIKSLERTLFQTNSSTLEEEQIRSSEYKRVQGFIAEASTLEAKGQMVISNPSLYDNIYLKDGDVIEIPTKNSLVTVYGEVMFPNTFAINGKTTVQQAIKMAGGFSETADEDKIFIIKGNGTVKTDISNRTVIYPGDKVVVLQEIDSKGFLLFKNLTQTIYQIALSTGVVLSL